MHRTRATVTAAAALLAAGTMLLAPGGALASTPQPTAGASAEDAGHGLKWFQASHGLRSTGSVDKATAKELQQAPDSELHKVFASPADLGPEELANARTVIGVGKGAQIPEQGQVIALMTAMQESKFVDYTDSCRPRLPGHLPAAPQHRLGHAGADHRRPHLVQVLLRSRPVRQQPRADPDLRMGDHASGRGGQAVQRSAFPDRYAQWEQFARDLLAQEGPSVAPIP